MLAAWQLLFQHLFLSAPLTPAKAALIDETPQVRPKKGPEISSVVDP
jgi:hypothetical protein